MCREGRDTASIALSNSLAGKPDAVADVERAGLASAKVSGITARRRSRRCFPAGLRNPRGHFFPETKKPMRRANLDLTWVLVQVFSSSLRTTLVWTSEIRHTRLDCEDCENSDPSSSSATWHHLPLGTWHLPESDKAPKLNAVTLPVACRLGAASPLLVTWSRRVGNAREIRHHGVSYQLLIRPQSLRGPMRINGCKDDSGQDSACRHAAR